MKALRIDRDRHRHQGRPRRLRRKRTDARKRRGAGLAFDGELQGRPRHHRQEPGRPRLADDRRHRLRRHGRDVGRSRATSRVIVSSATAGASPRRISAAMPRRPASRVSGWSSCRTPSRRTMRWRWAPRATPPPLSVLALERHGAKPTRTVPRSSRARRAASARSRSCC